MKGGMGDEGNEESEGNEEGEGNEDVHDSLSPLIRHSTQV